MAEAADLAMMEEWLLKTAELNAFYELDDGLKYTHPFATDAAVGRDYSDLTPAPPQATTARGAPPPPRPAGRTCGLLGARSSTCEAGGACAPVIGTPRRRFCRLSS